MPFASTEPPGRLLMVAVTGERPLRSMDPSRRVGDMTTIDGRNTEPGTASEHVAQATAGEDKTALSRLTSETVVGEVARAPAVAPDGRKP